MEKQYILSLLPECPIIGHETLSDNGTIITSFGLLLDSFKTCIKDAQDSGKNVNENSLAID